MPPAYEVLLLNTAIPQIQAAQSGDTYVVPRDIAFSTVANLANGTNLLPSLTFSSDTNTGIYREGADALGFTAGGGTNQMVLTSTGLGIGTATTTNGRLNVQAGTAATGNSAFFSNLDGTYNPYLQIQHSSAGVKLFNGSSFGSASNNLIFGNAGTSETMRIDGSGNLGLGVTPSAWDFGGNLVLPGSGTYIAAKNINITFGANLAYTGGAEKYVASNPASKYYQGSGTHAWYTAASGTAGNAISFTQAMTLTSEGRLFLGTTTGVGNDFFSIRWNSSGTYTQAINIVDANASANDTSVIVFRKSDDVSYGAIGRFSTETSLRINGTTNLVWQTGGTERARITSGGLVQVSSGGSVQIGGTADRATTAGTNRLDIFNGTAPVGTLSNGISIYSSSGEAYVMDAAGNATLFSPHDAETNEWIFKSKHTPTGKTLKIDVERLLKFVNDHFGLDAVHEFVEE